MYRIAWVVPAFIEGSGGHRTIFQNIQYLIKNGYQCDVYVEDKGQVKNIKELSQMVEKFFGTCDCNYFLGYELHGEYDLIFATAWFTAKIVRDYQSSAKKAYFIQDFEALFNPMGDGYLLACNSYCYGLYPITIGRWLSNKMISEYKTPSQYFDFCADKTIYKNLNYQREKAICFIYQPDKPRRCSLLGLEALGIVKHLRPDTKIYLYGSTIKGNIWFEHTNLGIISIEKCNELYNKCSVGLCISSSNPSRIPFEMMAAGLPVVDLHMENNIYDMPNSGTILSHYTPESIAKAIINILDNPSIASEMSINGQNFMAERSLDYGFNQFLNAVKNILNDTLPIVETLPQLYTNEPITADIVMRDIHNSLSETISLRAESKIIRFLRRSKFIRKLYYKLRGY